MTCKNCGSYYPDDEKRCPWCNSKRGRREPDGRLVAVSAVRTKVHPKDGFFRGLVGYAVGGKLGAMVGIVTEKKMVTFRVTYHSGHTGTETVREGSKRYRELSEL